MPTPHGAYSQVHYCFNPIIIKLFWVWYYQGGGGIHHTAITSDLDVPWTWNLAGMFTTIIETCGKNFKFVTSSYRRWRHHKVFAYRWPVKKYPLLKWHSNWNKARFFSSVLIFWKPKGIISSTYLPVFNVTLKLKLKIHAEDEQNFRKTMTSLLMTSSFLWIFFEKFQNFSLISKTCQNLKSFG